MSKKRINMQKKKGPNSARLIEGPVGRTLLTMTGPMLIAVLTMVGFNLADTYFIGQLGAPQLAAISFTFPVVFLIVSLSLGLGIGASAVIARAIGEGDGDRVKRITTDTLFLALVIVGILTTIGMATIDQVFTLLGAEAYVLPFIREYMSLWYPALFAVAVPLVGNSAIRATGDTRTPAMIMVFAVVINIVLDPLLIFGYGPFPEMGIRGAALATFLSRLSTMIAALAVLYYREKMLTFVVPRMEEVFRSWRQVLYIGIPAAGTNMLVPISTGIVTGMVAVYGTEAVAAYGVGSRLETLVLAALMALSGTLTPFIAQNWGAGRMDRVRLAMRWGIGFALVWGGMMFAILGPFGQQVGSVFSDEPGVIATLGRYLWIVPVSYGLQGVLLAVNAAMNALNRPLHATALMIMRLIVLYLPMAFIGTTFFGLNGIFYALVGSNALAGIIGWVWLYRALDAEDPTPRGIPVVVPSAAGD